MRQNNSLVHTAWNCKYHIVFAPKYRRQIIYGKYKASIGQIFLLLCERKGIEIHEAEACPDHIYMLVSIPLKLSISSFMGYLKGKSSLMIFDRHANLKYKYGNRKFWCRGLYVDTVGRNQKRIEAYIRNQLQEDVIADRLSLFEEYDPFTGEKNKRKQSKIDPLVGSASKGGAEGKPFGRPLGLGWQQRLSAKEQTTRSHGWF